MDRMEMRSGFEGIGERLRGFLSDGTGDWGDGDYEAFKLTNDVNIYESFHS